MATLADMSGFEGHFSKQVTAIQMPDMDDLEATRQIRAMGLGMPIVAMMANAFDEDRQSCVEAGMDDIIGKPVDPVILFATLARWLSAEVAVDQA